MPSTRSGQRTNARKIPTQVRSGAMVTAILQAATELLDSGEQGSYTTNKIAERAGASIGSLYQYFPSKDAITSMLIAHASARLLVALEKASMVTDWRAALSAMVCAAVQHQLERPGLARLLDAHEARLAALESQLRDQKRIHEVLASVLQRIPNLAEAEAVCEDLMVITRAMCDAAGERKDSCASALVKRVERAIFGYLECPSSTL